MSEPDDRLVRRVVGAASGRDAAEPCPDAEVLGLFAERQLDGAERVGLETHVAGCARCQATLAAIVRSAPVGVGTAGVGVREDADTAGAAWWSGWKWLVPVAATAAVVTIAVWVQRPAAPGEAVVQEHEAVVQEQKASEAVGGLAQAPVATELVGSAVASASPSARPAPSPAEARQEAVAVPAPEAQAKALASSAGARQADAGADARERSVPAAPVPPPAPAAVVPAEPRETEAFARRLEESIAVNRADSAAPPQAKAAAGPESAVGAASRGLGAAATAGAPAKQPAQLTGRVTYRTRAALPAGAVVDVRLLDVSRVDAPATMVSRVEIVTRGEQVPVPFTIGYDAAAIDPRFRYTVQVTVSIGGRVAYRTTTAHPVLTSGAPAADVEVVVEPMR